MLETLNVVPGFKAAENIQQWRTALKDEILQAYKELTLDQLTRIINAANYLEIEVLIPIAQEAYVSKHASPLITTIAQQFSHDMRSSIYGLLSTKFRDA